MPSSSRAWSLNVTDPDVPSPPGSGRIPVVLAKAYNLLPEMPPLASESSVTVFFRLGHAECSASLFPPSLSSPVTQRLTDHVTCRRACSCSGLRRPPPTCSLLCGLSMWTGTFRRGGLRSSPKPHSPAAIALLPLREEVRDPVVRFNELLTIGSLRCSWVSAGL